MPVDLVMRPEIIDRNQAHEPGHQRDRDEKEKQGADPQPDKKRLVGSEQVEKLVDHGSCRLMPPGSGDPGKDFSRISERLLDIRFRVGDGDKTRFVGRRRHVDTPVQHGMKESPELFLVAGG